MNVFRTFVNIMLNSESKGTSGKMDSLKGHICYINIQLLSHLLKIKMGDKSEVKSSYFFILQLIVKN
jgi:hypothetical protein